MRKIIIAVLFSILILAINFSSVVERAGDHSEERERNYWALIVVLLYLDEFEESEFKEEYIEYQNRESDLANQLIDTAKNLDPEHTRILVGKEVTKKNVFEALDWIRDNVTNGDRVLIIFSCHGWQINDTNGDEGDGKDEALITYDVILNNGNISSDTVITDDELGEKLDNISSKGIDGMCVVLNCCLSGGFVEKSTSFGKVYNQVKSARNFIDEFIDDISDHPSAKDISTKKNRVIITSSIGNSLALGDFTSWLLLALKGGGIFKSDKDHDGWVSAEEAFKWAKWRHLVDLYSAIVKERPIAIIPPIMLLLIILYEICYKYFYGAFAIPIPVMEDNDRGEELELVQLR